VSGAYTSANFHVGKDASGDVLVTYAATAAGAAAGAAFEEVRGGSWQDLLGRYDSQFPVPIAEIHGGAVALNPLLPPVLGAETFTSGQGHRYDGNGSDALGGWGVAIGARDPTGLAPGSAS
jgi:hypothetical protein